MVHFASFRTFLAVVVWVAVQHGTAPSEATAQDATITIVARRPADAIRKLRSGDPDSMFSGSVVASAAFRTNRSQYSEREMEELLDSLENTAAGAFAADEAAVAAAMIRANSILLGLIADPGMGDIYGRDVVARLIRIYRQSPRPHARGVAVLTLGRAICFGHAGPEAEAVLLEVATGSVGAVVHPEVGLVAVAMAGEHGIPLLRRLNKESAVLDQSIRVQVQHLAKAGYPVSEHGRNCGR